MENLTSQVSIIIFNRNGLKNIVKCLDSLEKITHTNYEVIVTGNDSKENEGKFLQKKYGNYIRIATSSQNLVFTERVNMIIREIIQTGTSDYILTLNDDITVEPDFVTEMIKTAQKHPEAGSIQCKIIWSKEKKLLDNAGFVFLKPGLVFNRGRFEPVKNCDREEEILACCASACLYKIQALEGVKIDDEYFDKDFFTYCEDIDLGLRLQWMGWKSWYCPQAIVYRQIGVSSGFESSFMIFHDRRNHIWMKIKNLPFYFLLKYLPLLFFSDIVQVGLDVIRNRPIETIIPGIKGKFYGYFCCGKMLKKRKKINKRISFSEIEKFFISPWNLETIKNIKIFLGKESKYETFGNNSGL